MSNTRIQKRRTHQRAAIDIVIGKMECAFTPQDVLDHAQSTCPGLGIATVYRAIRDLTEQGRIRRIVVSGGAPLYERTDVAHHHHFRCESCGEVTALEGGALKEDYRFPSGFKVSSHEVVFSGTCPDCVDSSGS